MTKKKFPEGFFTKDRPIAKPRYIDADGLREYWLTNGKNERVYNTNDFLDSIDYQPTADVQPVVHGHWIHKVSTENKDILECSNCKGWFVGNKDFLDFIERQNYCPYCGARMDEKVEEKI